MSRYKREHLPGAAFHLTARTQDHVNSFEGKLCSLAEEIILDGVAVSDAMLLGHIVMPNHFHIVLRQGQRPLGWTMQPIMRRLTLLVQRGCGREGHAFERAYRSKLCESSDHLRRGITYTHVNAWRKSLCVSLLDYPWSSHGWYCGERPADRRFPHSAMGLQLFIDDVNDDPRTSYLKYVEWRIEKDRCERLDIPFAVPEPPTRAGDAFFAKMFLSRSPMETRSRLDLRDRAVILLYQIEPKLELDELRRPYVSRHLSKVRNQIICGLLQVDYGGRKIARLFRVSDTVVSKCASRMRYAALQKS